MGEVEAKADRRATDPTGLCADDLGTDRSVSMRPRSNDTADPMASTKSIRAGDKHRTNRMFRRRIYAQGFTILAMVAGSFYWEGDRAKRRQYDELSEEKRKQERREAWVKELEARDQEEDELRKIRDKVTKERIDTNNKAKSTTDQVRSVLESGESLSDRPILSAAMRLWRRQ